MPTRPIPGVPIITIRPVKIGRLSYRAGETVTAEASVARKLIAMSKATPADAEAVAAAERGVDTRRHAGNETPPRPPANAGQRKGKSADEGEG